MPTQRLYLLVVLLLAAIAAACSPAPTAEPTATPAIETTPAPTSADPATAPPAATTAAATATSAPTTPASAGPAIAIIGDGSATATRSQTALAALAESRNLTLLTFETSADPLASVDQALAEGAALIVFAGPALAGSASAAAAQYPQTTFIGVEHPGENRTNLLIIGGPLARYDHLGFAAGMLAGFASANTNVGLVSPAVTDVIARKYTSGFTLGVRLVCGECTTWPVEVANYDSPAAGVDAIARLVSANVDSVFVVPGPAGDAALRSAIDQSLWAATLGGDTTLTATLGDRLLPQAYPAVDEMLVTAATVWLDNGSLPTEPVAFSAANGDIRLTAHAGAGVSPGEYGYALSILDRLQAGELQLAIDPATGEIIE